MKKLGLGEWEWRFSREYEKMETGMLDTNDVVLCGGSEESESDYRIFC